MFRTLRHLLPRGRAFRLTPGGEQRKLWQGLGDALNAPRDFLDGVYGQLFPDTTTSLDEWEQQFGLQAASLTEAQRRARLSANWIALGGQSPRYIQDTLQSAGFDVYVHEWWVPGTEPVVGVHSCATPRSPVQYLRRSSTTVSSGVDCGEANAACGEAFAEAGNGFEPVGYPLVNKILIAQPNFLVLCGETDAECGTPGAECGEFDGFTESLKEYIVPSDSTKFAYFLYIGAEVFGDIAILPANRKNEFETLCLKICPAHLWLGVLVQYQ